MARSPHLRCLLVIASLLGSAAVLGSPNDAAAQTFRSSRPWLGVSMEGDGGGPVKVKHVVRTSPADRAGIRAGDRIQGIDGRAVASATEVTRAVSGHAVGENVTVKVERDGKVLTFQATLAAFPSMNDMLRMDHVGAFAPAWKGIEPVVGMVPRSIDQLRGRVVLLDFWATWCGPCRLVAPKLSALQQRYGAQGLSVIGISSEDPEAVAVFSQRSGMRYGIGIDRNTDTAQAYSVSSLPTMFIIDKRGIVREVEVGYDPSREAVIESLVQRLLAEPAPVP